MTTKEVAEIPGVPVHLISRLDVASRWIKRFKLTRKTHVYDVQSLYVRPVSQPECCYGSLAGRRSPDRPRA